MADSALSRDPLERYTAIEQAYCDDRWGAVIQDGQSLLTALEQADPAAVEGLRERLQLLMAHAYLYGFGERDSAEDLYTAVLHSGAEAALRQIAEEGLRCCNLPTVATPTPAEEPDEPAWEPTPAAAADPPLEAAADAFWHEHSTPVSSDPPQPVTGVLAEPAAGGTLAETAAVPAAAEPATVAPPDPQPQDQGLLGWLNAEPAAAASIASAGPVMPWLEELPSDAPPLTSPVDAAAPSAVWPSTPGPEDAGAPAQAGLDPGGDGDGTLSRVSDPGAAWLAPRSLDSTAAQAAATGAAAGVSASDASRQTVDEPMARAPGVAEADGATARPLSLAKEDGTLAPPEAREPATGAEEPIPEAFTQTPGGVGMSTLQDRRMADATGVPEAALIPEVVEEPELIEVHQADPLRAEELEIAIQEVAATTPPERPAEDPDALIPTGDAPDVLPESGSTTRELELEADPEEPPVADGVARRRRQRRMPPRPGPFANPPQPVNEEEPEMLMGLLKVEMG